MDEIEGLCLSCVRNYHVRRRFRDETVVGNCLSCGANGVSALETDAIVDILVEAFDKHLEHGEFEEDSDGVPNEQGEPAEQVIESELGVTYECAVNLLERMNESVAALTDPGEPRETYSRVVDKRPPSGYWLGRWSRFEERLRHEARFFDPAAGAFLADAFGTLDLTQAALPGMSHGAVRVISPHADEDVLFRARSAASLDEAREFLKDPNVKLGPPPRERASAGRMNPAGVPVFYGAFSLDVALAEIRPPVGGLVVVGEFLPTRNLRLLDLNNITSTVCTPSIFSEAYEQECDMIAFLRELERRVSEPLQPHDTVMGYLATQAVAEYLSSCYKLDGMIYSSSQIGAWNSRQQKARNDPHAGCNVVLFRTASGVHPNDPDGAIRLKRAAAHQIRSIQIASLPIRIPMEDPSEEIEIDWNDLFPGGPPEFSTK
jgi:hypothetical protein